MPGPLPKFVPGDPATKALNSGFLNNVVERLNGIQSRFRTPRERSGPASTVEAYVVNNTSGEFPIRSIVASTGILPTSLPDDQAKLDFQYQPAFTVDVPAASTDFPMVCLEPIPAHGGVGRVAIGGIAVCTVNVTDAGHDYANPTAGDETRLTSASTGQVRILWKDAGTGNKTSVVYLVESAGTGGVDVCVDNVHVVGQTGQSLTVRSVTLSDPAAWPPVEASPVVEYTGVYESENRDARIIDSPGTATHIIPLYRDADGNHYVVFWKTCTFDDLTLLTDVNLTSIVQNADCSFTIVLTKTYDTKRWYVDVNPPGNPDSGLRLRIDTQANLPDVCGTGVGAPVGLLLSLTKSL